MNPFGLAFEHHCASMKLRQQIGLVTGGTKGIGAATAISLATEGADIAIVGRRLDAEAEETRRRIEALGRRCLLIRADVAVSGEATRCVEETIRGLGSVDVPVSYTHLTLPTNREV